MICKLCFTITLMKRWSILLFVSTLLCQVNGLAQDNGLEKGKVEKEASDYDINNSEYLLIDAEKFIFLEDYERALASLDQALEVDVKNHAAYFKKAEIFVIQEKLIRALKNAESAISLDKTNVYYYILAAQINLELGQVESAAEIYELMTSVASGYEKYTIEIIDVYSQSDRYNQAIELLEASMVFYPNYPELYLKKAEIERRKGELTKSELTISQAFDLFPEDPTLLLIHIQNLRANNQNTKAIDILEKANYSQHQAKLLLIETYNSTGQKEKAKRLAISIFENHELPLESKILALSQLVPNKANDDFILIDSLQQDLAKTYPDEPMVFENGGLLYSQMALISSSESVQLYRAKAIESFKKAALLNPSNFNAWLKVFEFEIDQRQWDLLQEDAEYLIDLYPNQAVLYYYYSESYRGLLDYEEAESLINQGLRMASRNELLKSLLLAQKARIKISSNKEDQADLLFNQALNTAEVDERAIYFYADWLAEVNPSASKELISSFEEAITVSAKWQIVKIKIAFHENRTNEARIMAETLIQEETIMLGGSFYELYGDILFKLGSQEEALNQWRKALTLGGFSEKLEIKIANKAYN